MSAFFNLTRAELFKLSRRAKYYVFPALFLLIYALYRLIPGMSANQLGGLRFTLGGASGLVLGTLLTKIYLPLIAFMGACDLFSNEFKQKSIRACVSKPAGRAALCVSKCAAVFLMGAAHAFMFVLVDTLAGLLPGVSSSGAGIQALMLLIDMVPFACVVAFAALINMLSRAPAFSMLLSIVLYIALLAVGFMWGVSSCLFTGYLAWHTLIVGYTLPFKALVPRVVCVLGYLCAFGALDVILFERMEF